MSDSPVPTLSVANGTPGFMELDASYPAIPQPPTLPFRQLQRYRFSTPAQPILHTRAMAHSEHFLALPLN